MLVQCSHCQTRVIPNTDGSCPACRKDTRDQAPASAVGLAGALHPAAPVPAAEDGNPYRSPRTVESAPEKAPDEIQKAKIARGIRAICILYLVLGSFATLGGIGLLLDKSDPENIQIGCVMLPLAACGAISALGVLLKRRWGVPFCQIISAVYLLSFPIGTILGGYFLVNIGKVKGDFGRPRTPPLSPFAS